jgi:hypothetical protein
VIFFKSAGNSYLQIANKREQGYSYGIQSVLTRALMWSLFYLVFLLLSGVCVGITVKKIQKDIYRPYYLKPIHIGYSLIGFLFFVLSLIFFIQL